MSTIIHEPRYTIEQAAYGWDLMDTDLGVSVGVFSTEKDAAKNAQARNALADANVMRLGRAKLRVEVAALATLFGRERVAQLLLDPPREIGTLQVLDLLCWIRQVRNSQGRRILHSFGAQLGGRLSEDRRIEQMTAHQRKALAAYLRGERLPDRRAA